MNDRLFPSPDFPSVPVAGDARAYPVHRIFCVGRNYADHAREMGSEVDREAPFYFMKGAYALTQSGATIPYPSGTRDFHHEIEFVVALSQPLFRADRDQARRAVFGYGVGLDMTRRDLQARAKDKGRAWDLGKNFEHGAVLGTLTPAADFGEIADQRIWLEVDGALRQQSTLAEMVWSVPDILADLSHYYHLEPGDVIYTGTPAGVGAVGPGNVMRGGVDGLSDISLTIGAPE